MTEKRFTFTQDTLAKADVFDDDKFVCCTLSVWVEQLVDLLNQLNDENEELKKDATTLIYANQDYRQQNQNLQKQLDYIQNSITNAIKHQKTELGQKALQEIIADYNEWMLGHKEAKE